MAAAAPPHGAAAALQGGANPVPPCIDKASVASYLVDKRLRLRGDGGFWLVRLAPAFTDGARFGWMRPTRTGGARPANRLDVRAAWIGVAAPG